MESPCDAIRRGSGCTSKARTKPPIELTSATPSTVRSRRRIVQSWSVRNSLLE